MNIKDMIAVLEAYERGARIEIRRAIRGDTWQECVTPSWDFSNFYYRTAPKEPKLVPHWPIIRNAADRYYITEELYSVMPTGIDGRLATELPPIMLPEAK